MRILLSCIVLVLAAAPGCREEAPPPSQTGAYPPQVLRYETQGSEQVQIEMETPRWAGESNIDWNRRHDLSWKVWRDLHLDGVTDGESEHEVDR